jgi:predicted AAA+ superfamily ATPase
MFYQTDILNYDFIVFDEIIRVKNFNIILKALIDKYPNKTFFCSAS